MHLHVCVCACLNRCSFVEDSCKFLHVPVGPCELVQETPCLLSSKALSCLLGTGYNLTNLATQHIGTGHARTFTHKQDTYTHTYTHRHTNTHTYTQNLNLNECAISTLSHYTRYISIILIIISPKTLL